MSTTVSAVASALAAWEVNERLIYHTRAGRMLAGLKYDHEGTLKVDGKDDFPLLQPWSINLEETVMPGAPRGRVAGQNFSNSPVSESLTLVFRFGALRTSLFMRRAITPSGKLGALEWLAKIRDAIETDRQGIIDPSLNNTIIKPITFKIQETETTQMAYTTFLEVVLPLNVVCRGERGMDIQV